MKLLFAYFDCENSYDPTISYRGLGECSLNFSTTHDFSVERTMDDTGISERPVYRLFCEEKERQFQLPKDFWGNRIYNISAIVGSNGRGKSTILHCLIKAVVKGLNPEVPFILVFQRTVNEYVDRLMKNKPLIVYCSRDIGFNESLIIQQGSFPPDAYDKIDSYPEELETAKIMLLDNTLSVSSINLDQQYSQKTHLKNQQPNKRIEPKPIQESSKQLFNKTLFSSIRYSNEMSRSGQASYNYSIADEFITHFNYETYQELRFLFDPRQQETIAYLVNDEFKKNKESPNKRFSHKLPFPHPKFVYFQVFDVKRMHHSAAERYEVLHKEIFTFPKLCNLIPNSDFLWKLLSAALYAVYHGIHEVLFEDRFRPVVEQIEQIYARVYEEERVKFDPSDRECMIALETVKQAETVLQTAYSQELAGVINENNLVTIDNAKTFVSNCCSFIDFIEKELLTKESIAKKKNIFDSIFQRVNRQSLEDSQHNGFDADRKIDIGAVNASSKLRKCVIEFIKHYRRASAFTYFIVFSTGLSSGEKNILRMMTQLCYALTETNPGEYKLCNMFVSEAVEINIYKTCDTLFLFLDEADLTYHPEWQRYFICLLTAILPRIYDYKGDDGKEGCKDIQAVLATHSPLLLSDIPRQNCIFLEEKEIYLEDPYKEDEKVYRRTITKQDSILQQTFGSNIHSLFNHAFFLSSTMGEFAYRKIVTMSDKLKELEENPDQLELRRTCQPYITTIDMIGDPILRNKLLVLYRSCFPLKQNVDTALSGLTEIERMGSNLTPKQRRDLLAALDRAADSLRAGEQGAFDDQNR